jgi:hypothetical protein
MGEPGASGRKARLLNVARLPISGYTSGVLGYSVCEQVADDLSGLRKIHGENGVALETIPLADVERIRR